MKAITGLSIGYRVVSSRIDNKRRARVLTEVDLFEISLVTFPANDAARISSVKAPRKTTKRKKGAVNKDDQADTKRLVGRLRKTARKLTEKS